MMDSAVVLPDANGNGDLQPAPTVLVSNTPPYPSVHGGALPVDWCRQTTPFSPYGSACCHIKEHDSRRTKEGGDAAPGTSSSVAPCIGFYMDIDSRRRQQRDLLVSRSIPGSQVQVGQEVRFIQKKHR
ncbi:pyridoxal-pyridoxamine kinase/hydroxymethylpyrimidine kinase [compost metagenome]